MLFALSINFLEKKYNNKTKKVYFWVRKKYQN